MTVANIAHVAHASWRRHVACADRQTVKKPISRFPWPGRKGYFDSVTK